MVAPPSWAEASSRANSSPCSSSLPGQKIQPVTSTLGFKLSSHASGFVDLSDRPTHDAALVRSREFSWVRRLTRFRLESGDGGSRHNSGLPPDMTQPACDVLFQLVSARSREYWSDTVPSESGSRPGTMRSSYGREGLGPARPNTTAPKLGRRQIGSVLQNPVSDDSVQCGALAPGLPRPPCARRWCAISRVHRARSSPKSIAATSGAIRRPFPAAAPPCITPKNCGEVCPA
jgi:hypothetical protein